MRVSPDTKKIIADAKYEAEQIKAELYRLKYRIEERPGTKTYLRELVGAIKKLEEWQRS